MPAADFLSRVTGRRDQPEWSVQTDDVHRTCRAAGILPCLLLDAFATNVNKVAPRYRSRYPETGSEGPAWASPWVGPVWAFPPWSWTTRALNFWDTQCLQSQTLILVVKESEVDEIPLVPVVSVPIVRPLLDHEGTAARRLLWDPPVALVFKRPCAPRPQGRSAAERMRGASA